jgi:flagellar L-ring protein precursor FlgH
MRKPNIVWLIFCVVAMYVVACQMALGQSARVQPRQQAVASGVAGSAQPLSNEATQQVGAVMQRNGGSLLRATLSIRADPTQATLSDVSFFAVPEPQPRTLKKHDLITVIIREESTFSSEASTDLTKEADLDARLTEFVKLNLANIAISGGGIGSDAPSVSAQASRSFKGEGSVDRSDSFVARMPAEVIDVKPNGTLVIQGRKRIRTDDEQQEFVLTGTCRAEDVTADNTVLSSSVHDLELQKLHKGPVRDASRKGWLGRLLDVISPF